MKYTVVPMLEKEKTKKALRGECWHEIVERDGGVICVNCGDVHPHGDVRGRNPLGWPWYCPNSPDHICHYFSEPSDEIYVISINGEKIILEDYDDNYETLDQCIFCGQPEERK